MARASKRALGDRAAPLVRGRNIASAPTEEFDPKVADLNGPSDVKQLGSMEEKSPGLPPELEPRRDEADLTNPGSAAVSDGISKPQERRLPMAVEKMLEQMESDAKEHLWWARVGSGAMIVVAVVVITVGIYWFWS